MLSEDLKNKNEEFVDIAETLIEQFSIKNRNYANDYFSGNYEPIERWLSIKRKVARLEAHYKLGIKSELPDETIQDTWKDLAIYCIMELIILNSSKGGNDKNEN